MTHLKIELNNGAVEEVSSAVISKLYDIVHSGNLDNTSNLIGRLHTTATYQDYIDYLEDTFKVNGVKLLIIDATKKYLTFEDPEVERVIMAKNIGDGVGLTLLDLSSITSMLSEFWNNTTITSANDLLRFTSLTSLFNRPFLGCTNLTSVVMPLSLITLSNVTFDPAFGGAFKNCTSLTSVTLNEGLLQIACQAFYGCTSLQTIDIPSTVTKLAGSSYNNGDGYGAFGECSALTTVTGGENITQIGPITFQNCSNLTSLPDFNFANITNIGSSAFYGCQNLQLGNLSLPSLNLSKIHYKTFYNCKRLTSITLPSTVTEIDGVENWLAEGIFKNCTALTTVTAPGLTKIGESAFYGCTSLTNIDLSNVTSIGESAFYGCTSLTNIDLSNVTSIGESAFYNSGISGVIDLSNCTTTDIFNGAAQVFAGCSNITLIINIPSTVTTIGGVNISNLGPLVRCTSLTKFDASSSGVTTINSRMFSQCDAISKIKLPNTVTSIAAIFAYCVYANTIKIYLPCTTPPTLTESWNTNKLNYSLSTFSGGIEVYVPDAEVSTYLNDTDWGVFTIKPISTWVD